MDFLRHIVNPVIDRYVERGVISTRDAIEIKKMVFQAESRYGFRYYGGDVVNLTEYLRSSDFKNLVELVKSLNAMNMLIEILNETKIHYADIPGLVGVVDDILENLVENRREVGELKKQSVVNVDHVTRELSDILGLPGVNIRISPRNKIIVKTENGIEVCFHILKQYIKVEFRFKRDIDKQYLKMIFEKVSRIAEKTLGI